MQANILSPDNPRGALEALVTDRNRRSSNAAALFAIGANAIRHQLASLSPDRAITITPLRGAMPMVWAAEGDIGTEGRLDNSFLELPIGEFTYESLEGEAKTSGPNVGQKQKILRTLIDSSFENLGLDEKDASFILLDEVQKGGTLSTLNEIVRSEMRRRGMRPYLHIIAAQDIRRRVAEQPKTQSYRLLSSNSVSDTSVSVIPMPLLGTDKAALLDTVILAGDPRVTKVSPENLTVKRNVAAENLFRGIGTIARRSDARHDPDYRWSLINDAGPLSERGAVLAESWYDHLVVKLDAVGLDRR